MFPHLSSTVILFVAWAFNTPASFIVNGTNEGIVGLEVEYLRDPLYVPPYWRSQLDVLSLTESCAKERLLYKTEDVIRADSERDAMRAMSREGKARERRIVVHVEMQSVVRMARQMLQKVSSPLSHSQTISRPL